MRDVERKPKPGTWLLDAEYLLRYEVLQVVFGGYQKKEISFASYNHFGRPPFLDHEYGLMYVSKMGERWVQQKYLFQPVYPTADGRWAGCGDPYDGAAPLKVGQFAANPFGLYDMGGGVAQWVADCYHKDFQGAPSDGSAWVGGDCFTHVLKGGSWRNDPGYLRPASRDQYDTAVRYPTHGFRVARSEP